MEIFKRSIASAAQAAGDKRKFYETLVAALRAVPDAQSSREVMYAVEHFCRELGTLCSDVARPKLCHEPTAGAAVDAELKLPAELVLEFHPPGCCGAG